MAQDIIPPVERRIHEIIDQAVERIRQELIVYSQQLKNITDFEAEEKKEEYLRSGNNKDW